MKFCEIISILLNLPLI